MTGRGRPRQSRALALTVAALVAAVACGRGAAGAAPGPIIGAPIEGAELEGAYEVALRRLPAVIAADLPGVAPEICLDRGIRERPDGVYTADHRRGWLDREERDGAIVGVSNRSPAQCPPRTFWVTVSHPRRLAGDSLAVPLSYVYVQRAGGARIDRVTTRLTLVPKGGRWIVVAEGSHPGP